MQPADDVSVLSEAFANDPYQFFPLLRDRRPLHFEPALGSYFISRHEDVRSALLDEVFTTEELATRAEPVMRGRVLAQMTGPEHTAKRKMIIRGITGSSLRDRHAAMIRKDAQELIKPHLTAGQVDLVNDFGKRLAVYVTLDLLGLPKHDWARVAKWHEGVAAFITSITMTEQERAHSLWCSEQLGNYLTPIIERRRRDPGEDYLSGLCAAAVDGFTLSTADVLALCMNILLAAVEPADKTLALLFKHLIDHPGQMRAVRTRRELLGKAIAETLRHTPPVQLIPRQPTRDVTLSGGVVPAGVTTFCLVGAANRDPAVFADPDSFDIFRSDLEAARSFSAAASHLAFGAGTHFCVGAAFAKTEIEVVANVLLDVLDDIRFSADFSYREVGLYTRGPESLLIDFTPREKSADQGRTR